MRREHYQPQGGILPSGYTQLEYIESTGTQYIDTGVYGSNNTDLFIKYQVNSTDNGDAIIIGGANTYNTRAIELFTWGKVQYLTYGNTQNILRNSVSAGIFEIDITGNVVTFTGNGTTTTTSINKGSFTTPVTLKLFAFDRYSQGGISAITRQAKIYICEIKNERLYVPALRQFNNKPGLYDLVTNTFFTNAGSGEFLYG